MKDSTTKSYPKLLSKTPCGLDLFEGQSHINLAKIISNEIITNEDCSIIGIDGGWGSGKSNLIQLISHELSVAKTVEKYHTFVYDAWGHQNDPHKRTILEELVTDLLKTPNPIFNDQDWYEKLDNLLAKKRSTTTKTVPGFGFGFISTILGVVFTPLITWIVSLVEPKCIKILCALVPYLVLYVTFGIIHYKRMKETYKKHLNWKEVIREFFLLYADKIEKNTKYEVISEHEPSSNLFRQWISDINDELKKTKHILLFVVDNMDRLPKNKVQELWSAIHTIFSENPYSNIRVIVPFDRSHINNAFQSEDIVNDVNGNSAAHVKYFGDDFINKTFYVVYRIPQPILSDWKRYFSERWRDAFGPDEDVDDVVLQIFDLKTEDHSPRNIIAFINEIVTLRAIVEKTIPDVYLAIYVYGRVSVAQNPPKEILNPTFLTPIEFLFKDDETFAKYISAIYYQLPVEKAMDVVFTQIFNRELNENNPQTINTMFEKGVGAFWNILFAAIPNVTVIPNAIMAMNYVLSEDSSSKANKVWQLLYHKLNDANLSILKYEPYQGCLLSHLEKKGDYARTLVAKYIQQLQNDLMSVADYINAINNLLDVDSELLNGILEKKSVKIKPEAFIELLSICKDNWMRYAINTNEQKLDTYLSKISVDQLSHLIGIKSLQGHFSLPTFKSYLLNIIKTEAAAQRSIQEPLRLLLELDEEQISVKDILNVNQINILFAGAEGEYRIELIAMRLSFFENWNTVPDNTQQSIADCTDSDVDKTSAAIWRYTSYENILLHLKSYNSPFLKTVARHLTITPDVHSKLNVLNVLRDFNNIVKHSDITPTELIHNLDSFDSKQIQVPDIPTIPVEFFKEAIKDEHNISKTLLFLANDYLKSISQSDWKTLLLNNESFEYQLLSIYHPKWYQNCYDAFAEIISDYVNGSTDKLSIELIGLIGLIVEQSRHDFKCWHIIRDLFINGVQMTSAKFEILGESLLKFGDLKEKENALKAIIPTSIMEQDKVMSILEQYGDVILDLISNNQDGSVELVEKLHAMKDAGKTDDRFQSFCNMIDPSIFEDKPAGHA